MLTGPLPARLDHRKMAGQEQVLEGSVPVSQLSRLSEMLADVDGDIDLKLAFSRGNQGRTHISGRAHAAVALICQNCLQSYQQSIDCEIDLEVVGTEAELAELDDDCEAIVAEDGEISPTDMVEDELIMSIPMIPRHRSSECPNNEYQQADSEQPVEEVTNTHRPFAGLAAAMKQQDNQES